jgi:Carboxypeptidase regulatory-like domain/Transposase DDE domain
MVYGALTAKTAALFFTSIAIAAGQSPTGSIGGVVRDPSGAAVSTALVKAITAAKGLTRTIIASAEGDYSFPALLAGEYEVSVEASGFQRIVRQVSVETGTTTTADFALRVGDTKDSVTLEGAVPQTQYDSHTVGGVITHGQIENLPLNGRNFLELAKLQPGVLDAELKPYGIEVIAPHRSNRKNKTQDGRRLRRYRRRWKVERLFAWLQNFRRLVVRYERHAENFLGMLHLGCCLILLRNL